MKYSIYTTGCKANQWDSFVIGRRMEKTGHTSVDFKEADVVIINGCTLTDGAQRDIRRFVNRVRHANEKASIVLAGCHAQVYSEQHCGADLVLGHQEKFCLPEYLGASGCHVSEGRIFTMEEYPGDGTFRDRTRFFFKIQDGCDNFCTYCVVPYARGSERSRSMTEIMDVMGLLMRTGVQEVVLTGIEIASYRDPETGEGLKGLLRRLEGVTTPPRIRISSIDPLFIDDEFIDIMARSKKIARSLHIPLQSGSDRILEKMGRPYTAHHVHRTIEGIIERMPDIGIGLDVIAGFPGEQERDFLDTVRCIDALGIHHLHIFPFSARKGTVAASMEGQVPVRVKKERVTALKEIDVRKRLAFYEKFIGKDRLIIPEAKIYNGFSMRGYTDNYIPVYIPYKKTLENKLVRVTMKKVFGGTTKKIVLGEVVSCL